MKRKKLIIVLKPLLKHSNIPHRIRRIGSYNAIVYTIVEFGFMSNLYLNTTRTSPCHNSVKERKVKCTSNKSVKYNNCFDILSKVYIKTYHHHRKAIHICRLENELSHLLLERYLLF